MLVFLSSFVSRTGVELVPSDWVCFDLPLLLFNGERFVGYTTFGLMCIIEYEIEGLLRQSIHTNIDPATQSFELTR